MTWLHKHMLFGLFFVPADGRAKSAQQLKTTVQCCYSSLYIFLAVEVKQYSLPIIFLNILFDCPNSTIIINLLKIPKVAQLHDLNVLVY